MTRYPMPALGLLVVLLAGAVAFSGLQAGPDRPVSKQDQVQELLKRVKRLEAQVAELKRQREADVAEWKRRAEAERKAKSGELDRQLEAVIAQLKGTTETPKGATDLRLAPQSTLDGQPRRRSSIRPVPKQTMERDSASVPPSPKER